MVLTDNTTAEESVFAAGERTRRGEEVGRGSDVGDCCMLCDGVVGDGTVSTVQSEIRSWRRAMERLGEIEEAGFDGTDSVLPADCMYQVTRRSRETPVLLTTSRIERMETPVNVTWIEHYYEYEPEEVLVDAKAFMMNTYWEI